jgi:uncharacterized Zn finger protein (UPF0148 family)
MPREAVEPEVCAICHGDVEDGHELQCGHKFHSACIIQWFRNGNASCPMCRDVRQELTGLDCWTRSKHLMQKSRNKDAPVELKRAADRVRKAVDTRQKANKQLSEFISAHKEILSQYRTLQKRVRNAHRQEYTSRRLLGILDVPGYTLPPLVIRRLL